VWGGRVEGAIGNHVTRVISPGRSRSFGYLTVGLLLESWNRHRDFDMICTIIDHLTSMVHLVPIRQEYKAKEVAELVFDIIYKAHGLPGIIVSDHDSLFTSMFWSRLHSLIGTELQISSSWHPQTDGATERVNRTLGQMLRQAIGPTQKNWVNKLPGIEFAINCASLKQQDFHRSF
jgi:transposase InsO family protein